jgi:hypothetical protein
MSDTVGVTTGTGWTANPDQGGAQQQAIYQSRPIYQAAGARRAPAHDADNTPSDLFVSTYGDAQYAVGVVARGRPDSFFGGLAAQELGQFVQDWLWGHRATPPTERELSAEIAGQQAGVTERVNSQALSDLMSRGGSADLLRRRDQVGSQVALGAYLLGLDGRATFYLLGHLRVQVYLADPNTPPAVYAGEPQAYWSSLSGVAGSPVWHTVSPAHGISLAVADLPVEWGGDFRLLYQPQPFSLAAAAAPATASVGYAVAMIDPEAVRGGQTAERGTPRDTRLIPLDPPASPPTPINVSEEPLRFRPRTVMPPPGSVGHLPAPAEGDEDLFAVPAADAPRGYVPEEEEGYDAGLDSLSGIGAEEEEMNRSEQDGPRYQPPTAARRPTAAAPSAVADLLQGNTRLVVGGAAALLGLIVLCVAAALFLRNTPGGTPTLATPTPVGATCFPPSNACIQGRWKQVWESDGGLAVFGLPLSPPRQVGSIQVQDFQRFRLEYHPENKAPYDILFANLGTELYHATGGKDAPAAQSTQPGCKWFDDVKHNVCGDFLTYWTTHGRMLGAGNPEAASLALFGTPLDEARQTTVNGKQLTVQWFQKARFELHPDEKPEFRVQLGLLGAEAAAAGK